MLYLFEIVYHTIDNASSIGSKDFSLKSPLPASAQAFLIGHDLQIFEFER
jgi:hypothetical protein